jgi:hypothetical protein
MANMSYCRFQNTVKDLQECFDCLFDDLSPEEAKARKQLISLCRSIVAEVSDDEDDE